MSSRSGIGFSYRTEPRHRQVTGPSGGSGIEVEGCYDDDGGVGLQMDAGTTATVMTAVRLAALEIEGKARRFHAEGYIEMRDHYRLRAERLRTVYDAYQDARDDAEGDGP